MGPSSMTDPTGCPSSKWSTRTEVNKSIPMSLRYTSIGCMLKFWQMRSKALKIFLISLKIFLISPVYLFNIIPRYFGFVSQTVFAMNYYFMAFQESILWPKKGCMQSGNMFRKNMYCMYVCMYVLYVWKMIASHWGGVLWWEPGRRGRLGVQLTIVVRGCSFWENSIPR